MNIDVQIYTEFNHEHGFPAYESLGASGMDIRCNEHVCIEPKQTVLVHTGIFMAVPDGYEIQVRPRSGLSLKTKMRIANAPGTVDSDFRGELCVIVDNTHGSKELVFALGDRIAQIVLQEVPKIAWYVMPSRASLGYTLRGSAGFNSTGTK